MHSKHIKWFLHDETNKTSDSEQTEQEYIVLVSSKVRGFFEKGPMERTGKTTSRLLFLLGRVGVEETTSRLLFLLGRVGVEGTTREGGAGCCGVTGGTMMGCGGVERSGDPFEIVRDKKPRSRKAKLRQYDKTTIRQTE